jgi:hypothetical protein
MNDELKAFTITKDLSKSNQWKVKKCFIMRHPEVKELFWNTKIEVRMDIQKCSEKDIIEMYQDLWKVPYIEGINMGDVVSYNHKMIMSTWQIVCKSYYDLECEKDEVQRVR